MAAESTHTPALATQGNWPWRGILRDSLWVSISSFVCHALAAVTSLIMRAALSPAQMGTWQGLKLLLSYGNYTNLGVSKGAARNVSFASGSESLQSAERGVKLAFTANCICGAIYSIGLTAYAIGQYYRSGDFGVNSWAVGILAVAVLFQLQRHVTFGIVLLRARQRFIDVSKLSLLDGGLTCICGGLGAMAFGLPGLYAGTLIVMICSCLFLRQCGEFRMSFAWDFKEVLSLIRLGSPILAVGIVTTCFRGIDRVLILTMLPDGEYQLGCYSLALLVSAQLYGLANVAAIVMGPRFAQLYGRTRSRVAVAEHCAASSKPQALVVSLLAGLAYVTAGPILSWLLPEYRPGLVAMQLLIPGTVALMLGLPISQYLVAVFQEQRALLAVIFGLVVGTIGNVTALSTGAGIQGAAIATTAAYSAYLVVLVWLSLGKELSAGQFKSYLSTQLVAILPTLITAWVVEQTWTGDTAGIPGILAKSAAVLLVWMISAGLLFSILPRKFVRKRRGSA